MNQLVKKIALFVAICMTALVAANAQGSPNVEAKVNEIIKKYENVKGVECMFIGKGISLTIVKKMLNSKLGKEFMKGVTCIAFIEYGDASQQTCSALQKELDAFTTLLDDVELGDDVNISKGGKIRCFAAASEDKSITDLIIAVDDNESKMIMYMGGKIKISKDDKSKSK